MHWGSIVMHNSDTVNKTRTKVVHKNVSKSCDKIRNSKSKKTMQPLNNTKVVLCDLKSRTLFSRK